MTLISKRQNLLEDKGGMHWLCVEVSVKFVRVKKKTCRNVSEKKLPRGM